MEFIAVGKVMSIEESYSSLYIQYPTKNVAPLDSFTQRFAGPIQSSPVQSSSVLSPKTSSGLDWTEFRNQGTEIGLDWPVL